MNRTAFRPEFSLLLLLAAFALAAPPEVPAGIEPTTHWDDKLDKIEAKLEAGKYGSAQRRLTSLRDRMVRESASFEGRPRALARATALLAVAEAGLGNHREAAWHWHSAHALDLRGVPGDLGRFGAAGAWLLERPPRQRGDLTATQASDPSAVAVRVARVAESTSKPIGMCGLLRYTQHTRGRLPPPVKIEVRVDPEGLPHDPVLMVPARFPGFATAALDSVRHWRFQPATGSDGEPVPALTEVRVNHPGGAF